MQYCSGSYLDYNELILEISVIREHELRESGKQRNENHERIKTFSQHLQIYALYVNHVTNRTMAKTHSAPFKLPPFQADQCNVWFSQAELQFTSYNITAELTKYNYVVCSLSFNYNIMVYLKD